MFAQYVTIKETRGIDETKNTERQTEREGSWTKQNKQNDHHKPAVKN